MRLSRTGSLLCAAGLAALGACKVTVTFDGHGPGGGGVLEERFDFIDTLNPNGTTGYTCNQVGIDKIGFTLTPHPTGGPGTPFAEILVNCVDGRALKVDGLPIGPYDIISKFYDVNGHVVVQDNDVYNPADPQAPVIKCEGDTADCKLSTILHVNSTGDFDFFVDYGNAGGANCQGGPTGGNGVGQQAVIVDNSRNQTIPIRLVAPPSTPAAPDGMILNPGDVIACVENNVTQTIFNQFIGFYDIKVKGLKVTTTPAFVCYQTPAATSFQVTASPPTSAPVILVPFMPDPGKDAACNAT